jgi:hypothetical protein
MFGNEVCKKISKIQVVIHPCNYIGNKVEKNRVSGLV